MILNYVQQIFPGGGETFCRGLCPFAAHGYGSGKNHL